MASIPPAPDSRRPAGYFLLRQRHGLNCLPHHVESFVTQGKRQTHSTPVKLEETYPRTYWPGDDDFAHMEFALKREGLHLQLLRALLPRLPVDQLTAYIQSKPTSAYARRIWFLYEAFSGQRLNLPDVAQEIGVTAVPRGSVDFEERIAGGRAGARRAMFVLRAGPDNTGQLRAKFRQLGVGRQLVVVRHNPGGGEVGQGAAHLQPPSFAGGFVERRDVVGRLANAVV